MLPPNNILVETEMDDFNESLLFEAASGKQQGRKTNSQDTWIFTNGGFSADPSIIVRSIDGKPLHMTNGKIEVIKIKRGRLSKTLREISGFGGAGSKDPDAYDAIRAIYNPSAHKDFSKINIMAFKVRMADAITYTTYTKADPKLLKNLMGKYKIHTQHIENMGLGTVDDLVGDTKIGDMEIVYETSVTDKKKKDIEKVLLEVQKILKKHNLDKKLMYGKCIVAKTLRGRTLGLYYPGNDTMAIKSSVKPDADAIHTIVHELGHRHDFQKLTQAKRDMYSIRYNEAMRELRPNGQHKQKTKREKQSEKNLKVASSATTVEYKGRKATYKKWGPFMVDRADKFKISLKSIDLGLAISGPPEAFFNKDWAFDGKLLTLDTSRDSVLRQDSWVVSDYARTNAKEFYAELFAYYCTGKIMSKEISDFMMKMVK